MRYHKKLFDDFNSRIHEYIEKTYPSPVCITDEDLERLFLLLQLRSILKHNIPYNIPKSVEMDHIRLFLNKPLIIGTEWETYFNEILLEMEELNKNGPRNT